MPHGQIAKENMKVAFTAPKDLIKWVDERAAIENRSRSNFIVDVLEKLRDEEESNY